MIPTLRTAAGVPFFIFAGELMGRGGMSKRLVAWALSILGGLRGSLPLTAEVYWGGKKQHSYRKSIEHIYSRSN